MAVSREDSVGRLVSRREGLEQEIESMTQTLAAMQQVWSYLQETERLDDHTRRKLEAETASLKVAIERSSAAANLVNDAWTDGYGFNFNNLADVVFLLQRAYPELWEATIPADLRSNPTDLFQILSLVGEFINLNPDIDTRSRFSVRHN